MSDQKAMTPGERNARRQKNKTKEGKLLCCQCGEPTDPGDRLILCGLCDRIDTTTLAALHQAVKTEKEGAARAVAAMKAEVKALRAANSSAKSKATASTKKKDLAAQKYKGQLSAAKRWLEYWLNSANVPVATAAKQLRSDMNAVSKGETKDETK